MKKHVIDKEKFEGALFKKGLLTEDMKQIIQNLSTDDDSGRGSKNSTPEKSVPLQVSPKLFTISGSMFYDEVKNWILAKEDVMQKFNEEFDDLSSEIKDINDLYSLVLQEAIKHKNLDICTVILDHYEGLGLLTNVNEWHENSISLAIKSHNKDILDKISEYINHSPITEQKFSLSADNYVLNSLIKEFNFNIPIEEHDYYFQNFLLPLYGDINDCMNFG